MVDLRVWYINVLISWKGVYTFFTHILWSKQEILYNYAVMHFSWIENYIVPLPFSRVGVNFFSHYYVAFDKLVGAAL